MSFESLGIESGAGANMSPEEMEKLSEQLKENTAKAKAIKGDEKKHRDKDDTLIDILMKFIKSSTKTGISALLVRLLNENVPVAFLLAILLLGNTEMQRETGIHLVLYNDPKITLKLWTESIIVAGLENPYKVIRNIKDQEGNIKLTLLQLVSFVMRDYFADTLNKPMEFEEIRSFTDFTINGVVEQLEKRLEQMQLRTEN